MRCCKPMFPSCEAANSLEKFFSYLHATSRGGDSILTYLTYLQRFPHDTRSCTKKLMDVWICGLAILESYVDLQLKLLPFLRSCSLYLTCTQHQVQERHFSFTCIRSTNLYRFLNDSTKICMFSGKEYMISWPMLCDICCKAMSASSWTCYLLWEFFLLPQMHMTASSAGETLLIYLHTIY